jgi:GT2 family glycosyltransferase/glycosyltransferase involved in cell wall biosynthesis
MGPQSFRVKPYSDRRYKFVVRAKVDGKWRRRYFRDETEAQAYADQQNRLPKAKSERSRKRPSKQAERGQTKLGTPDGKIGKPLRIAHYLGGAWRKHLPFGYDLVRELEPSIFVELGVYKGESYFAFCQSVEENKLATQCYGIDTWRGDQHAGLYGPEIGRHVAAYNERYQGFSRLLTMTFREGLAHFADGSIDLLHIDGAHRYEDVKEDFESWHRKLSSRGVVLFHDVMERDKGFGVYKLWQEIARPQASFFFEFGHGLGVWRENAISKSDPPFLQKLFLADAEQKRAIVEHYKTLAAAIEADTIAQRTLQTAEADLQVYPALQGAPCEERLSRSRLEPGRWGRLKIELPWGLGDGTAPCRIDPINSTGVVDVAAIRLRSVVTGECLWRADAKHGLETVIAAGTSFRISTARFLRLLSYGADPQIHLPSLSGPQFQAPLLLNLVLRYELGEEVMGRAIAALSHSAVFSRATVAPPEIEPAPAFTDAESFAPLPTAELSGANKIQMAIYSAGDSGYSEERSTEIRYTSNCWTRLDIALQLGLGSQPLRLDPLPAIGLIDVASMSLRSAIDDEVLWRANGGGGLETLQVAGTAVRIPHPHLARILSYGEDPQIYLPAFPDARFDGPLRLEVWLKTETGPDSIRKGIADLADISSRALTQDSQSRGLLEQTTRQVSEKDSEIDSLRAELERAVSDRDAARAEVIEERQRQQRSLEERVGDQEQIRSLEAIRTDQEVQLRELKSSLETAQSENLNRQARIENLESIRTGLESDVTNLNESFHRAQTETAQLTIQLKRIRQHLIVAKNESEFTLGELAHARAESFRQRTENMQSGEAERLRAELGDRASEVGDLWRENGLLRGLLKVEETAKVRLIEQFTSAAENLRRAKKDLELIREAALKKSRRGTRWLLGLGGIPAPTEAQNTRPRKVKASSYRFWIDTPTGPSVIDEKIFYSGWILPSPGDKVIAIRAIREAEVFVGQYGFERRDVEEAFPDEPEAARSGFSITVSLALGMHELNLQFLSQKGSWVTFHTHQHEVRPAWSADEQPSAKNSEANIESPIAGCLEHPVSPAIIESGLLLVHGWVCHRNATISRVVGAIGDQIAIALPYSFQRNDVATFLPDVPGAKYSGFAGYLPVKSGFSGESTVRIEAILADGTRTLCFERSLTLKLAELPSLMPVLPELSQEERYARWIETNKLTPYVLRNMGARALDLAQAGPLISIIVPTFNTPASYLEALIASVTNQLYPHWQLCFADDASTEPHVRSILEQAAADDSRIDVVFRETNGHIVEASNSALAIAKGEYVGLLDHDDLLSPDALLHIAEAIAADISIDLLYTDEDKIAADGTRYDPIFKGSFSPEMALTHNYIQHFTVIRKSLVAEVGGFRSGFEGAQDLDLYLRVLEKTTPQQVKHLPYVCYHWRCHAESTASKGTQKTYVFDSARKGIAEALVRRHVEGARPFLPEWAENSNCCLYQIKWSSELLKQYPVTIVIPTKDRADLLRKCVASLERTLDSGSVNLIIVDDYSEEQSTRNFLRQLTSAARWPCRVIQPSRRSTTFNFSRLINTGVAAATTPLVLLLNNDTEALTPGWLEDMVGWMSIEGVAAVGSKLLYPDNTIQHAGVIVGANGGLADHIFHKLPASDIGFNFLTHAARNVSAVTAACMLTSRTAFDEVGGFDEDQFGMEYNDVDFCLRLTGAGRRVVFTPQSLLLHHCGQSRQGLMWRPAEHLNFLRRYHPAGDPYYNENLDINQALGLIDPNHFLHKERVGRLKVLMVSHNLNLEGAPRVLFDHAAYFVKTGGYAVTIVSQEDGPLRGKIERAGISLGIMEGVMPRPGEAPSDYATRLRGVGETLGMSSFDLVICNTLVSFWGVVLADMSKLPVIWHVHESTTLKHFFPADPVSEDLAENCFVLADRIVFESSATRRLLSQYQRRDNFRTIPGSIDVGVIETFCERHSQRSMKLKHGLDPEKLVVSLIGTTCPRKGQHVFIEAIARLQEKYPDAMKNISFVMLGARKSAYLDLLYAQLATIEGTDTRLVEECPDVFDFYRLTDIFVCASFQESFPRVILEAMAFKLPIVSTDVFGISEIILHQSEGLLGPPGDASFIADGIERLLWDPVAREELGTRAHVKISRLFDSRTQLSRQFDLTKEVVARHI